ncbi:digestive cysteine proteinase 2-like [Galleria mellonella]|uniref:Digestive cysteine proteinase 2-like n=1 Tax=Galleria mellonella TaxID=7137 RepID=A0A6J1WR81_GALME|nr:digestive cysteine proteinase 2-like [Galleria mellonella]
MIFQYSIKMFLLNICLLLCVTLIASEKINNGGSSENELEWPEQFSCQAIKLYLDSGLVEDYKIWRTPKRSRIDYNKGAVKSIIVPSSSRVSYGLKYSIHPQTTNDETNKMVCTIKKGTRFDRQEVETILPSTDYEFESQGPDTINDKSCVKYYSVTDYGSYETRSTLWVTFSNEVNGTVPIRFEEKQYNNEHGYLDSHYIWEFYNYDLEFDDSVFNISQYDCSYETTNKAKAVKDPIIHYENQEDVNRAFESFKLKFDKKYAHKKEHAMRRSIFEKNLRLIRTTNSQNLGYKLAINQFADRTPEEMKRHKGLIRRKQKKSGNIPFPYDDKKLEELSQNLPTEFDTRLLGLVNPVRNQESCGSCWTYGTTAAVEGAIARKNGGRLLTLSNQALIDCAWEYGAFGCDGGSDTAAFQWMIQYGLPTEEEYGPYANQDGYCLIENMTTIYPILGFTDVTPNSIVALKVALINHGPLSTSIDASGSFSFYSGGIFYDLSCTQTNLDHEVTLVGYGEENGDTYWIIKNSWGSNWGIDGYMHISARDNNCGVATEPTYAVV